MGKCNLPPAIIIFVSLICLNSTLLGIFALAGIWEELYPTAPVWLIVMIAAPATLALPTLTLGLWFCQENSTTKLV